MLTGEKLGEAISLAIEKKGVSKKAIAEKFGVKPPSVQDWIKRGTISKDKLFALIDFFSDVCGNDHWGLSDISAFKRTDENAEQAPAIGQQKKLAVVGTAQLGDDGYWAELEYPAGHGDGYVKHASKDASAYALRCRGDSMKPRIKNGEYVIIEPNHPYVNGDEVMVKCIKGRVMVKELLYVRDNVVYLGSVNELHGKISISMDDVESIQYVAAFVKSGYWFHD